MLRLRGVTVEIVITDKTTATDEMMIATGATIATVITTRTRVHASKVTLLD